MSVLELVRDDLRDFGGYSSARKEAKGGRILLNANESPWPAAGDALGLNRYPDPQPAQLLERLAKLYAVSADRLLVGRGSDEAIDLLVRALCPAGASSVLVSPPTFGMYEVCARVQGAAVLRVPLQRERDFRLDVETVLAALREDTRIVFVCSPNNPTGQSVDSASLDQLAQALCGRAVLVIDEAYAEFAPASTAIGLAQQFDHVAVLRTLSKAYALAGARIGSLIADPGLIRVLRALMAPYPLPLPCVQAALSALQPGALALAQSRVGLIQQERQRLSRRLRELPVVKQVWASDANFVLVAFADAAAIYQRALAAGIVLRAPAAASGLGDCLRISIGTPEENDAVLRLLASAGAAP